MVRRDIARIKTVLAQKVMQAQAAVKTEVKTS
jgi:ribosomal protein L29